MHQKFIMKFNKISFTIIVAVCALLPVFFLPSTWGGIAAVKGILLYGGVFLAFSFWLLAQFVGGSIKIPKHTTFIALGLWVAFALISALWSQNTSVSLWGRGFAIDSFATVLVLAMFTFLVATFAREQKRLVTIFLGAFIGSVGTVLLQVILYLSQKISFVSTYLGHVANQGTLVGSWVDFAYFVTLTFLLALLMYEVLIPKGFFKVLSLSAMVLSLVVLVFLNFKAAWIITIVSALLVFVYKSSVERSVAKFFPQNKEVSESSVSEEGSSETQRFPLMSFAALLVGLFFFLSSNSIGATIAQSIGVNFTDIRPSFASTTHVMRATLGHDPLFGAGAGRFGDMWNLYHPLGINQTQFWNSTFDGGFSMFQTIVTTNGALTAIALLAVIILSLLHGFRLFNYQFPDRFSRFIAVAALIMFVSFASLFIFSSPGIVLIVFGFLYLGLLLGVSSLIGRTQVVSVDYLRDPRLSFFTILILVLATMLGFTATYFSGNRFASIVLYNKAVTASSIEVVQNRLDRALSLSQNDIYWRTRTAVFVRQFTTLANTQSPDKAILQANFSQAEQSAKAAVAWDKTSANNWLTLSQVYQLVVAGDSADSYTAAKAAADEAQAKNPNNPLYVLNQAQLAFSKKDVASAKDYIAKAIVLKPDYLDAFILRAQIRMTEGESRAAIEELTLYTRTAPYDEQGFLLLAQSYTGLKEYQPALDAYKNARQINPQDPNALLGMIDSLTALGQKSQALEVLQTFATTFPNISGIEQKKSQIEGVAVPAVETTPVSEVPKSTKKQ
jgi:tetratricopeptide (TPR) repeat protein